MTIKERESPAAASPESFGFERIDYRKDHETAVATVTIDRQAVLNCFDFQTLREMARAFEDASWDEGVAVVVVTGAGERAFSTGADLDEQAEMGKTSGQYWLGKASTRPAAINGAGPPATTEVS